MSLRLEVKERVQQYLTDFIGAVEVDSDGDFTFPYGSTRVYVSVSDWLENRTAVRVYCFTNFNVPISRKLERYVATQAYKFGAPRLRYNDDGTASVIFEYTVLGDHLDPDELRNAVTAVSVIGDELDDEIMDRFGGERWVD